MKQILISKGQAILEEVPAPQAGPGEILVKVDTSCLSIGTEMGSIKSSGIPIWRKALNKPEKAVATLKLASSIGVAKTWQLIKRTQSASSPTGYSASGVVMSVGRGILDVTPGDRVACAGSRYAYHSEYIRVPRNLCVTLPDKVSLRDASTVTLGAIALQGIRRSQPQLGETFVVIGLGILGQLTVQILKANGCRVIAMDVDAGRVELAKTLGANVGICALDSEGLEEVAILTDGVGADGVIITAATESDDVVANAFKVTRKKGRVVLVGDVGLNLNRDDFYKKEIDFLISTSYGPGRYDAKYEELGLDYPIGYVRWTENRNMGEYINLISEGRVNITPLITKIYPFTDSEHAYANLNLGSPQKLLVLLEYPKESDYSTRLEEVKSRRSQTVSPINVALIGAGSFAKSAHLPNLNKLPQRFTLKAIASRNGHIASSLAKEFGAKYSSTSYENIIADEEVDSVIISTRHNLHAEIVIAALKKGKNVLVEKPLAINQAELDQIKSFYAEVSREEKFPVMMTGYNRRHSIYAIKMQEFLDGRKNPFIINYRMNAGYIPGENWVHGDEGGGRNLGEACHVYDLFLFLSRSKMVEWSAHSISPKGSFYQRNDNFIATLKFADGSLANLIYTAMGHPGLPKEQAEIYCDGKVAVLSDYRSFNTYGGKDFSFKTPLQEKGLKEELIAFADAIDGGISLSDICIQIESAEIALNIEKAILGGNQN
ncbi:bi-domain-containing oxidoreductase [Polynucleobacter sp. AM-7D1]|uniref:bi-domain-containing oxidoreductase n=1 Tax=Polynucleobacter sp. AM-7D1 TaxID=2689102 RepID=UPI001BFCFAC2|nr:bi-domain-containing oxidoreductase [Polynucleobacter sp. AM-7D1]QWE29000.1 bi-domain-containing oxidoreductase [Polynucleobacter sp. AM-7D1]